ncbi:MAG: UDP-N-acetylmuramate--L-alanine ligase [Deltaproteobacteria bacterium]|nr:UDP-N-acetylmuramate--L-alanine ligase [Candidatus Anaeroferrophillus wilburensis]MBN2888978.1 UDP-N-acetylmuramate--L-alanine ligase [Deltaproteobacteria bacterium]
MHHKVKRIHFIGIGGIGMSGIAEVLLNLGYQVTGSDLRQTPITDRLAELGAEIYLGHSRQHVGDVQVVVRSTAVKNDNPELVEALERAIPVIPRAEMLAELMRLKYGIAVAGTHGKTTTTSMIATMLSGTDLDPTIVIGGRLDSLKSNARLGQGEILVAEADESDGSFMALSPIIAVITNIDREHLDHYQGGLAEIEDTFVAFANKVPFYGLVIVCLDDPRVQEIIPRLSRRLCTYGFSPQADFQAIDVRIEGMHSSFTVVSNDQVFGEITIGLPGRHYVQNALAAVAAGFELGLDFALIQRNLEMFAGVQRRMQVLGECRGALVIDDYGHHPTEIKVTLAALRQAFPGRRLLVVFQPHRYTRTQHLFHEFLVAFNEADELLVSDIYPAGESPIAGVSGEHLADEIRHHGHKNVHYRSDHQGILDYLAEHVQENYVVITFGAGDITRVAHALAGS